IGARPILELAVAIVPEITIRLAVEAMTAEERSGIGQVDVEVAVAVEVHGDAACNGLAGPGHHAEVVSDEDAGAVVEVERDRLGHAIANHQVEGAVAVEI